jgi:hypothetical protein
LNRQVAKYAKEGKNHLCISLAYFVFLAVSFILLDAHNVQTTLFTLAQPAKFNTLAAADCHFYISVRNKLHAERQ